ncbi:hypothetical protein RE628_08590 [Paenibacillus sp. D2_2]|uniref:hypothetical protein n=1 Tax=Paenibacillus sp. D2_2 TaxID=3073092 RepID=UPI002815A3F4|nr:hypothetical protein [Paenibacillus sp. D2_2]WMT42409.1 hypothetical protein RE628_08590 [Paenibacillus sp. D2_2]
MNDNNDNQHDFYGGRKRLDFPRKDHSEHPVNTNNNSDKEEYASEISPTAPVGGASWDTTERREIRSESNDEVERSDTGVADSSIGRTVGYVGVGIGIASLFLWSIVLGPLAAVLGFYAYSQGAKTSGGWAIGLGIVATLSYFFLIPFTR